LNDEIYEVSIELKSPCLIAQDSLSSVLKNSSDVIPGSTVRGAILTELHGKGFDVAKELNSPTLIFHPAYPLVNGERTNPAHPFIYQCKICGSLKDGLSSLSALAFDVRGFLSEFSSCDEGHLFALKSLGGKLIYRSGNSLNVFHSLNVGLTSVGINKLTRSSEMSMIYRYVCLNQGSKFGSLIIDKSNTIKSEGLEDEFDVNIGRGSSRGLGRASVKIKNVTDSYLSRRRNEIKNLISKQILFIAIAPVFSFSDLEIRQVPAMEGMHLKGHWLTGTCTVSGYSLLTGLPKAKLLCGQIGSLFLVEFERIDEDKMIDLELSGIGPCSSIGLNIVEALKIE
jgi:hypothetical protein